MQVNFPNSVLPYRLQSTYVKPKYRVVHQQISLLSVTVALNLAHILNTESFNYNRKFYVAPGSIYTFHMQLWRCLTLDLRLNAVNLQAFMSLYQVAFVDPTTTQTLKLN